MTPGRYLAVPTEKMVSKWPNKISGALGAVSFRSATRTGLAVVDCSRTAVRPWLVKKSSTRVRVASTLAASRALVSWLIKAVDRLALAAWYLAARC